ncbi:MAG: aminoglycoside phosphotransferase family protein [Acidobacteriota bacterium]
MPRTPSEALLAWSGRAFSSAEARPSRDAGLINRTYVVGDPPAAILQWVAPIFERTIHYDIEAVTARLAAQRLPTPRLVPTDAEELWLDDDEGCWRILTYIPGVTVHRAENVARARAAGSLLGRFHCALADWERDFATPPRQVHDTPQRMAELEAALAGCDGHALAARARGIGNEILAAWRSWEGDLDLPTRACHGDPKISNLRFAADGRGVCLVDLDTLGDLPLAVEMGDAWRSWCNPVGEDAPEHAELDLDLFAAAATGWLSEVGEIDPAEQASLVPGIERIALELAARFCTDAVLNIYFREDRERFPDLGAHNLVRARGQLRLARSCRERRVACEAILRSAR